MNQEKMKEKYKKFWRQTKAKKHVFSVVIISFLLILTAVFSSTLMFEPVVVVAQPSGWTLEKDLIVPTDKAQDIDFSANNSWVAQVGNDGYCYISNVSGSWDNVTNMTNGTGDSLQCVEFSNNSQYVAFGGTNNYVNVYATNGWSWVANLTDAGEDIKDVSWSYNNTWLATASRDSDVRIYRISDWSSATSFQNSTADLFCIDFSHNTTWIAFGNAVGEVCIYRTSDWSLVTTLNTSGVTVVESVTFSHDNQWLVVGSDDEKAYIWKTSDWSLNKTFDFTVGGAHYVKDAEFSYNHQYLALGLKDMNEAKVYWTSNWTSANNFSKVPKDTVSGVDFSNDNNWFGFSVAHIDGHSVIYNTGEGAMSVYSISGLDGSDRITFEGQNNTVIWSNESYSGGGGHLVITSQVNSSDNVTEIHINISDNIDTDINADNVSIEVNVVNGSGWNGTTRQVTTDGENITLNSTVWASGWCHGSDPFPITDETVTIYVRFKLTLTDVGSGTYTLDICEVAWKITYTP